MDIAFIVDLLLNSTIMAGILFFLILIVKRVFRNHISAKWHYIIWFVFILRLAVPYAAFSSFNLGLFTVNSEKLSRKKTLETSIKMTTEKQRKMPVKTIMRK